MEGLDGGEGMMSLIATKSQNKMCITTQSLVLIPIKTLKNSKMCINSRFVPHQNTQKLMDVSGPIPASVLSVSSHLFPVVAPQKHRRHQGLGRHELPRIAEHSRHPRQAVVLKSQSRAQSRIGGVCQSLGLKSSICRWDFPL